MIVVRADPVICGHSGEARNLAEVALTRGFDDVRIVTWPIPTLQAAGLPLKPLDAVLPYSDGITVERPDPVGDYKVPDARFYGGIVGRLVELFTDGVPTVAMSLYLTPHATAVNDALAVARATGLPTDVTTIAEAVGPTSPTWCAPRSRSSCSAPRPRCSPPTSPTTTAWPSRNSPSSSSSSRPTAIDARHGTSFAAQCRERVAISYPAIDSRQFTDLDPDRLEAALARRGLTDDGYVLFLSRVTKAKGVDDLIDGYAASHASDQVPLVIAGTGPEAPALRARAAASSAADQIMFFDDVDDDEKTFLMAGSAAYVLPSKPRPEFVETFGIALVEKMLAGGGPGDHDGDRRHPRGGRRPRDRSCRSAIR